MKSDVERNSAAEESSAMNDVQCRRQCDIVTVSVTCPHDRLTGCTGDHNGSCKCSWGQREAKMQHPVAWNGRGSSASALISFDRGCEEGRLCAMKF